MKSRLIMTGSALALFGVLSNSTAGERKTLASTKQQTTRTVGATSGYQPIHEYNGSLPLERAVEIALRQNPDILRAIQEIERTRGQIIEVRAQALPQITLTGNYDQQDRRLLETGGSGGSSSGGGGGDFNQFGSGSTADTTGIQTGTT